MPFMRSEDIRRVGTLLSLRTGYARKPRGMCSCFHHGVERGRNADSSVGCCLTRMRYISLLSGLLEVQRTLKTYYKIRFSRHIARSTGSQRDRITVHGCLRFFATHGCRIVDARVVFGTVRRHLIVRALGLIH